MKFSRRPRSAAFLLLLAFCLPLVPLAIPAAHAQTSGPNTTGPVVREIDVQYVGRPTITRERVLAQMRTAVGQPFNQANAEEDIRSLYGTGDVTNVRIFSEPAAGGVKVIVIIQTRATIREIVITGSRRFSARALQKQITSKKGSTLSEETVEERPPEAPGLLPRPGLPRRGDPVQRRHGRPQQHGRAHLHGQRGRQERPASR